jgi:protein-S-isoprenylcysteine O-methyltransferase Ste14
MIRSLYGDVGYVALFGVLLFGPAGTFDWPRAWLLLLILLILRLTITLAVTKQHRTLLVERSKVPLHAEQPWIDRLLLISFMASFAAQVAFTSFDRFHLRLLTEPPSYAAALGILLFGIGWIGVGLALYTNAFAVTVVRHQSERQHALITTGPYKFVRHPMYASLILVFVGLPLWLASSAGVVAGLLPTALLVIRIGHEERLLRKRLPGYIEYSAHTPWRLLPGVW